MSFLKVERWNGEAAFEIIQPASISNVAHTVYDIDAKAGAEHGGVEWEVTLARQPPINTFQVQLITKNLRFFYQPSLTEEFAEKDCLVWTPTHIVTKPEYKGSDREVWRPPEVVGSYAVYHASKRNGIYRAGKAFHIYRPKLIDAYGKTAWGTLNIEGSTLVITLPAAWLASAKYPVVVDPTFGKTDVGGTSGGISPNYAKCARYLNDQGAGTTTTISLYNSGSGAVNHETALYDDDGGAPGDPNNLKDDSPEVSCPAAAGWTDFAVVTAVANSTLYHLCWNNQAIHTYYWDTGSAGEGNYEAMTYGTWANPYGAPDGGWDRLYSIHCDFTSAGGVSIPVAMNQYGTHINKKIKGG